MKYEASASSSPTEGECKPGTKSSIRGGSSTTKEGPLRSRPAREGRSLVRPGDGAGAEGSTAALSLSLRRARKNAASAVRVGLG